MGLAFLFFDDPRSGVNPFVRLSCLYFYGTFIAGPVAAVDRVLQAGGRRAVEENCAKGWPVDPGSPGRPGDLTWTNGPRAYPGSPSASELEVYF